jgi:hypothetical protein
MSDRALSRLRDAIDACAAIEEFVAGVSDYAMDFKQSLFVGTGPCAGPGFRDPCWSYHLGKAQDHPLQKRAVDSRFLSQ